MTVTADLAKILDRRYEALDLHALSDAPVDALAGVSSADAQALRQAFGIETIGDLGRNEYVRAAAAITALADSSR
ncbi:hypothetical protein GCM10010124_09050 [Pilimelia terevasa]|uniref:Uncharacterized protein n=1 Tax=Pilimelia terevasa TaxID=53372 RepID=A0A8J3BFP2_9ACTN|nr:hypothetical protein [Pilimelia terevasa]GGK18634.1 hypothetical protein GCM10010124_09050 [Pilimelia terevasa]